MRAEEIGVSRASNNQSLPFLDYYLTFIHYFGYSIDPNDESHSVARRYYSSLIRVKQAADEQRRLAAREQPPQVVSNVDVQATDEHQLVVNDDSQANEKTETIQQEQQPDEGQRRPNALKMLIKFYAISLTTFLTCNHILVLIDYILQGSKEFMQLILELRLVITKLSAIIFVLSWHQNQVKVRQLLKLVKSTSIYILAGEESSHLQQHHQADNNNQRRLLDNFSNQTTDKLNRHILWWFLMCVAIILFHFSLSEAEIRSAQHLWQWLDDYSLHTLSNQTTSISGLFIMASFDNYIYTVHVYGTRLIGASIICIVCTMQIENITCLRRQALKLLTRQQQQWQHQNDNHQRLLLGAADRRLLFVLGESDWLQVEANVGQLRPTGWLSGVLLAGQWSSHRSCCVGLCTRLARSQLIGGGLNSSSSAATAALMKPFRRLRQVNQLWKQRFGLATPNELKSSTAKGPSQSQFKEIVSSLVAAQSRQRHNHRLADDDANEGRYYSKAKVGPTRQQIRAGQQKQKPTPTSTGTRSTWTGGEANLNVRGDDDDENHSSSSIISGISSRAAGKLPVNNNGNEIEVQLERLARKYELIRTVNERVDNCFGQMLLNQYSFLFLMSCIDVVYFSLSFSPNTKTKYIIISGMILLWWPYLLIYKFASDIGVASNELLITVRRLARLALVVQHSSTKSTSWTGAQPMQTHPNNYHNHLQCLVPPTWPHERAEWPPTSSMAPPASFLSTFSFRFDRPARASMTSAASGQQQNMKSRARIFNKLDHVFKQTNLSIVGVLTVDKFFLLNFAKIVITASVMTIQFISK